MSKPCHTMVAELLSKYTGMSLDADSDCRDAYSDGDRKQFEICRARRVAYVNFTMELTSILETCDMSEAQ